MYRIEKSFKFSMGHRLSKHEGLCFHLHGHNYTVKVGLKSKLLNKNDMVIDFSNLKKVLNDYFMRFDHTFMVNKSDKKILDLLSTCHNKFYAMDNDPTAERMAEEIYFYLNNELMTMRNVAENQHLLVDYVTVFESDDSNSTYSED